MHARQLNGSSSHNRRRTAGSRQHPGEELDLSVPGIEVKPKRREERRNEVKFIPEGRGRGRRRADPMDTIVA